MTPTSSTSSTVVLVSEPPRRSRVAVILAAVVLVGWCLSGLTTFGFAPVTDASSRRSDPARPAASRGPSGQVLADSPGGTLEAHWDGPAVHLDWTGGTYTAVADSFVGERTVVPGDQVRRTLQVTNDSPDEAVLSVWVDPHTVVQAAAVNPALASAVRLEWTVADTRGAATFASLLTQDRTRVVQLQVPQGGTVPVTLGFLMPATTADHARAAAPSTQLGFDVTVTMTGDGADPFEWQALAATGAEVAHVALLAALALVTGALLWLVGRRRRCRRCGTFRRSRTPGSRRLCPGCAQRRRHSRPGGHGPGATAPPLAGRSPAFDGTIEDVTSVRGPEI